LWEGFKIFVPKGFTTWQIHVLRANFVKFGLPKIGKVMLYLPDKKKQKIGSSSRCRFYADRAQNLSRSALDHPNPFTSGGVIAERVNVVQMRHKVFPILGEVSASSTSKLLSKLPL